MNTKITKRLSLLRNLLNEKGLHACIIPTSDPHQSEYTADFWKFREFVSGFSGSAGLLVVSMDQAVLWTDSRYFIQAEEELKGTGIRLFKSGVPETPSPEEWIVEAHCTKIGIDGSVFSGQAVHNYTELFELNGISLDADFKPYETVWPDRPNFPHGKIYVFPEIFSGETVKSKIEKLRSKITLAGADGMPLTALDEIAWLFNLRGEDVDFNPVGICYAFIGKDSAVLFADKSKLTLDVIDYLQKNNIDLYKYESLPSYLRNLSDVKILLDCNQTNYELCQSIPSSCQIMEGQSPVTWMKAIKNDVELSGFRKAMIKDGIALTRFWMWMEKEINTTNVKNLPNESVLGKKIAEFRQEQKNYVCESFSPIVGFNDHGAIVHYESSPESAYNVSSEGFLLIDSGGQYLDGTTDITRSWSFFKETPTAYKEDYTSLLKGVIALSCAVFPAGTRGAQLDVLARQYIWQRNCNFGHGTGHGVGHFLNVHEGPQSIRMNENPAILEVGMVTSNEPGIYRSGQYGIRLENLILVCEQETSDFGRFLTFETLTLFPFDLNSIEKKHLSSQEINWINQYHQMVYDRLNPELNEIECNWLKEKTRTI